MKRTYLRVIQLLVCCMCTQFIIGCDKSFLEAKPDKSLLIPSTLEDYEKIVYNEQVMTLFGPGITNLCSDDAYITDAVMSGDRLAEQEKLIYLWDRTMFDNVRVGTDWVECYQRIFYANVVLEGLVQLKPSEEQLAKWNSLYGAALFYRALGHYQLLNLFSPIYQESEGNNSLGIPLRMTADINDRPARSSVKDSYAAVINDLQTSLKYLDEKLERASLPDQVSSWALLARVYLSMSKFDEALNCADEVWEINSALLDYNTLNLNATKPIPAPMPVNANVEVIFFSQTTGRGFTSQGYINNDLVALYDDKDIRKKVFFKEVDNNLFQFVGTYNRTAFLFNGLTTAEVLLIKAECLLRIGRTGEARQLLSMLHINRYLIGNAPDLTLLADKELMKEVLLERRKELVFRDIRWSDLKRLNLESEHQVTLERIVNGKEYKLLPNSTDYALPIPFLLELELNKLPQNP